MDEGKITTNSWDDKETKQKRYRTEIIVNDLSLLSAREDGGAGAGGSSRQSARRATSTSGLPPARMMSRTRQRFPTTISLLKCWATS